MKGIVEGSLSCNREESLHVFLSMVVVCTMVYEGHRESPSNEINTNNF